MDSEGQTPEIIGQPLMRRHEFSPPSHEELSSFQRQRDDGFAPRQPRRRLPLVLFLLTCVSTWLVGGWTYAVAIMSILGAHEMGHFLQARRYRVPASFPYFIPMPLSPLGTMGAVIVQQAGVANRKALFDIAISGPLAGLMVALPVLYWGMTHSRVVNLPPFQDVPPYKTALMYGDPLLVKGMTRLIHGRLGPGQEIEMPPLGFAGWVGIFITGLNLIPIGQLDGGHILYTLLRRKAVLVARALFLTAVLFVIYGGLFIQESYYGWFAMLAMLWLMGTRHPPTADDSVPLGTGRVVLGWLTLLFIFVGFTPTPFYEYKYRDENQPGAAGQKNTGERSAPVIQRESSDIY